MKKTMQGRVTNITFDSDGQGHMHVSCERPGKLEGSTEPAGHVAVRLLADEAEELVHCRAKVVRVTLELVGEEPKA